MNEARSHIYEFDEFRLDASKRLLTKGDGELIQLTPKVFDTLLYLVRNGVKVIGKDELMSEIWSDSIVEENNLNQNISILRRIFGEKPGEQRFIVTVAGRGYRFVPEVRLISESGATPGAAESNTEEIEREPKVDRSEDTVQAGGGIENARFQARGRRLVLALVFLVAITAGAAGFYFWGSDTGPAERNVKTLAVLPFKPLVLENRNEALELGLADTLISKLSGSEAIAVRPLSAIRRYNSLDQDPLVAARDLGVDSVVDGTIQTWGDRIRISARLIRTTDGKQIWSAQFDEKFTDLFGVQDTISEKVASALKVRLGGKRRPTEDIDAYQLYMKGRYHVAKGAPPDLRASIPFFEQAIERDPQYALAYTGLAHAYGVLGLTGDTTLPDAVSKAREAERKALELDDTLGETHNARCMGLFWYEWDWSESEKACVRAIEIDPNNSDFHGNYAMVLSNTGRHEEALTEAKRSRELNPLNLTQVALEGQFLLHAGRVDEALAQLRKMSELEPKFWMPHMIAASAYIEKGMFAEAIAESLKEKELSGGNVYPLATYALAKSGKRDGARLELQELLKSSSTQYVSPYNVALVYKSLDENASAIDWLEKAYEQHDAKMTMLKVDPKWNTIRNDERFVELMRRMRFH